MPNSAQDSRASFMHASAHASAGFHTEPIIWISGQISLTSWKVSLTGSKVPTPARCFG